MNTHHIPLTCGGHIVIEDGASISLDDLSEEQVEGLMNAVVEKLEEEKRKQQRRRKRHKRQIRQQRMDGHPAESA